VIGEQTDKKSGIQCFECNVDPFEKNVFHFWERYESFQAMNDTRASLEHTKFMTDVRPLLIGPIGLAVYEYKDGQIGHMMNPIGMSGPPFPFCVPQSPSRNFEQIPYPSIYDYQDL
jgi:quinol monooxygenase YgiN